MVSSILGRYLVSRGLISSEQLRSLLQEKERIHVKLGLIAVAEGLMTQAQADEVYESQSTVDKRFGEIAVEKGYLTEGEVDTLLDRQGNSYLAFAQALSNQNVMTVEQLEGYMVDFQSEYHLTLTDMEDLKSDDVDRILPICVPMGDNRYLHIAGTALRAMIRFVGGDICPKTAYFAGRLEAERGVFQCMVGEETLTCSLIGSEKAFSELASAFAGKESAGKGESFGAIEEMLDCVGGMYIQSVRQSGISLEKQSPWRLTEPGKISAEKMLVLPLWMVGEEMELLIVTGEVNLT